MPISLYPVWPPFLRQIGSLQAPIEYRIKELLHGLHIASTSYSRFSLQSVPDAADHLSLCAAAGTPLKAKDPGFTHAQVIVLRERLLKLAVWVERSHAGWPSIFPTRK